MPMDFENLDLVAWRVEQGIPDTNNPLLEPEMPWDAGGVFAHGTVLKDPIDNLWKAWQISASLATPFRPGTWRENRRITYLESSDGTTWYRPDLTLFPWQDHEHTNIIMDIWSSYASVNIDTSRNLPYEMFAFRDPGYPGASGEIPGLPLKEGVSKHSYGLYRYQSEDGKKWTPVEGPIDLQTEDSCYIYRNEDKTYTAYHKTEIPAFPGGLAPYDIGDGGVRLITHRTSEDGSKWSDPPRLVMTPDWRDPSDTQFMEICPTKIAGGYVATATVYHNHTQHIDLQLAASRDGINWWRPQRKAALPNPPLGEYGGGMIWPMRKPILDEDKMHVYYSGVESIHGDMYNTEKSGPRNLKAQGEIINRQSSSLPDYGALCRATWNSDRLWALLSAMGGPYPGTATTHKQKLGGKSIFVNTVTIKEGELRLELLDESGEVITGFSENDCIPIQGDHKRIQVKWTERPIPDNAVKIRFILKRALLYGFEAN